jgi:flagellar protein FliS
MAINNPYEKIKTDAIYSATPEELTLMLYNAAVKFGNQAIIALEKKDYMKTNNLIHRMKDIIREFQFTLKKDYEISEQLNTMYTYIYGRLTDANVKKDMQILEEAVGLIRRMRDTWKEAMKTARMESSAKGK